LLAGKPQFENNATVTQMSENSYAFLAVSRERHTSKLA
jgi:hypothetical protein